MSSVLRGMVPGLLALSLLVSPPKAALAASASVGTPTSPSSPGEVEMGPHLSPPPRAVILNGPAVLRQSPAEIQTSLGKPVRTKAVPPGDFLLPEGGTSRVYRGQATLVDIDFEREAVRPSW